MTTSSQLHPNFKPLNHFPHTQRLSLMNAFCYSAFLSNPSKQRHKTLSVSVSVTGSLSFVKNMAYLGLITVPNDS
ncbi:hypothetical protein ACTXOU_12510 [Psychrobacter glacincola]